MLLHYQSDFHPDLANLCKRLRCHLGGDRPSQTTHQALSSSSIQTSELDLKLYQGGIPLLTPHRLAPALQSLPPKLDRQNSKSIPSCSKAPRGLFVLLQVDGIFTAIAISPGSSLRQFPTRYAFHAGQNLPDKEFRYLRTIIVIADVHWRFGDWLAPLPLTFQHWSGVSPYTSPYGFAETCVFDKQSVGIFCCGQPNGWRDILRTYV